MTRQYSCKVCGELGHNSRTCSQNNSVPIAFKKQKNGDRIVRVIDMTLQSRVEKMFDILEETRSLNEVI